MKLSISAALLALAATSTPAAALFEVANAPFSTDNGRFLGSDPTVTCPEPNEDTACTMESDPVTCGLEACEYANPVGNVTLFELIE